jgi:nicotinate-nucleotide pyrophosphorylase (carboxylating)
MEIAVLKHDGDRLAPRDVIAKLRGSARALLTAERTALNILGKLSGVATATRALVDAVGTAHARVVETRKTTPGMRALEKYAVRCGGGANHRFGLDDAVLIKDNHIAFAGGVREAVARVKAHAGHLVKIELEVDTLEQLREALELPIDAVLLDNMPPETMREAVRLVDGRLLTEASGNVRLATIAAIAATGVDLISSGAITHSAPNLDIGLDAIP